MASKSASEAFKLPVAPGRKLSKTRTRDLERVVRNQVFTMNGVRAEVAQRLISGVGHTDNAVHDQVDTAQTSSSTELNATLLEHMNQLGLLPKSKLKEIIDEGRFGLCIVCNDEMDIQRVRAMPQKPICKDCQQTQETGEPVEEEWDEDEVEPTPVKREFERMWGSEEDDDEF